MAAQIVTGALERVAADAISGAAHGSGSPHLFDVHYRCTHEDRTVLPESNLMATGIEVVAVIAVLYIAYEVHKLVKRLI